MKSWRGARIGASALLTIVLASGLASGVSAASSPAAAPATTTYAITGTIVGPGGTLGGIDVFAYASGLTPNAVTSLSGAFSIDAPPGDYRIYVEDPLGTYLHGYYDEAGVGSFTLNYGAATIVHVTSAPVALLTLTMQTGFHIKGKVTGPGSTSLAGIQVEADSTDYSAFAATSPSDGTYSVLVPAETFTVYFHDPNGNYVAGYYSSGGVVGNVGSATPLPVTTGDVGGINVQLAKAPPWTVSLGASAMTVTVGTSVTLTATTNKNVGPTSYYIVILNADNTVADSTSSGTSLAFHVTSASPTSRTYHAVVGSQFGTSPIATSHSVTVNWTPPPSRYHPMAAVRVLDTRNGTGLSGKLTAGVPRTFQITGLHGIPAGATAITANATVVNSTAASSIYLGPAPVAHPSTYTLSFNKGQVANRGVTVALSPTGALSLTYMASSGTTDLVIDVTGYFATSSGGDTYHALTPARVLDTRYAIGMSGKLVAFKPRTFTVWGHGGVPSTAKAVTGNVTVVNSSTGYAIYMGPAPVAHPAAWTINFVKGQIADNSLTVALSSTGALSATFMGSNGATTDLVFDVTGYYTADATGLRYVPLSAASVLDTRVGTGLSGKFAAGTPRTFTVRGHGGVPTTAAGITGVVSVVGQTAPYALGVGPVAAVKPTTSALDFLKGDVCSNGLTLALSSTGTLSATYVASAGATTNVVIYVNGYFVK